MHWIELYLALELETIIFTNFDDGINNFRCLKTDIYGNLWRPNFMEPLLICD